MFRNEMYSMEAIHQKYRAQAALLTAPMHCNVIEEDERNASAPNVAVSHSRQLAALLLRERKGVQSLCSRLPLRVRNEDLGPTLLRELGRFVCNPPVNLVFAALEAFYATFVREFRNPDGAQIYRRGRSRHYNFSHRTRKPYAVQA